jgi:osmotically inducible protein OsmC
MKRTGSAHWTGDLRTGKGAISTESGALNAAPYGFNTRFGDQKGTNPEELIGAAHAACFSMALSNELSKAGISNPDIQTSSVIELKQQDGGFSITAAHLNVKITAKGADKAAAQKAAETAEKNCPVSKLLRAEISMDATIET